MSGIRVFAPKPREVLLRTGGADHAMIRTADGWWHSETQPEPDAGYQFVLDGEAVPDPRSGFQPEGVFGPSRVVDHEAFNWTDRNWNARPLSSAILYELHIGTFTPEGTFDAVIGRLDRLVDLGVTHIELMPVAEFPGSRGWGYDGVDLFAPHHAYGGPDGLKRLVNACHARGVAMILDVVYNHLGPSGNYLDRFGPYYNAASVTPWGAAVNFDGAGSQEVRRFFLDNALMWLRDYHLDGLRIDAVHALLDTSATHLLEELSAEVESLEAHTGRHLVLIAESDLNDDRVIRSRDCGGYGIHAQWSDDFHHALHTVLTGERHGYYRDFGRIDQLARSLREAFVYAGDFSEFRGRPHGRHAQHLPGWQFIGYLQNHDQIGNRAQGERSSQLLSVGKLMIGAALVFTSPFIPMVFQGEEWGASTPFLYFTSHEDESLGRQVSEGRRREFEAFCSGVEDVPDPQALSTFQRSKLNWDELNATPHLRLFEWHKALIQLRRSYPELTDGQLSSVRTDFDNEERWLLIKRGKLQIACNFADRPRQFRLRGSAEILLSSSEVIRCGENIHLHPESVAILKDK